MTRSVLQSPVSGGDEYYEFFERDYRGKSVLDIGAGSGSFEKSNIFLAAGSQLEDAASLICADITSAEGLTVVADAHRLPFVDGHFDIVIANNLLEHLRDPPAALAEMRRVLIPGGYLLFTVPFLYPVHEAPNDYFRPTRFGMAALLEDFDAVVIKERGKAFSVLARYVWLIFRPYRLGRVAEVVAYPVLWLVVHLDRFDRSRAFALALFGEAKKPDK